MIKVCHIASGDLWAGAEVQLATLLPALSKYQELDLLVILLNPGRLAQELEKHEIPVTIFDESKLSFWRIFKKLLVYFTQHQVDILHSHGYKEHVLGSIAAKLTGVRCIIKTVHGLEEPFTGVKRWKMSFYSYLDNQMNKYFTDRIVAVSHDMLTQITKRIKTPVVTIHNGIELDRVSPRQNPEVVRKVLGINPEDIVVGTVGRIVRVKGLDYLLQAARLVKDEFGNVRFLIVGEGPYRKNLEWMVQDLHLKESVIFTGYREDVYDLINAMDIFVLSSFHEGIPTVLLETMALQKPIIATKVGGVPEIITDGETGFLVPPKNVAILADRIIYLIKNANKAQQVVLRAKTRVEHEYTTFQQADNLYLLYKKAAQTHHK